MHFSWTILSFQTEDICSYSVDTLPEEPLKAIEKEEPRL